MKLFRCLQEERNLKKIPVGIPLRFFTILYLIFLIGFQLQSPTTAYFSDTVTVQGTFAAESDFEVEGNVSDEKLEKVEARNVEKEKPESEKIEVDEEELDDEKVEQ